MGLLDGLTRKNLDTDWHCLTRIQVSKITMDILTLNYCGRITFAKAKKNPKRHYTQRSPQVSDYIGLVIQTRGYMEALRLVRLLGLSSVPNLQNASKPPLRASRGKRGIGSAARVRVRDCAGILQERHGAKHLTFATLTLPPSALVPEVLQHWSEIVRKLRQWFVYQLEKHDLPPSVLGVVEVQEARQRSVGLMPCLHLHFVFVGRKKYGSWVVTPSDIDKYWCSLLQQYTKSEINVASSCQLKRVEKDAAGYLGKYMSKGAKALQGIDPSYLPSSWVVITRDLLEARKKATIRCEGSVARWLWGLYSQRPELFRFGRFVEIEAHDGQAIVLGWYGDLVSRKVYAEIKAEIHALRQIAMAV